MGSNTSNEIGNIFGNPSKAFLIIKKDEPRTSGDTQKGVAAMGKLLAGSGGNKDMSDNQVLRVQYNPSSLFIHGCASTTRISSMQQKLDESVKLQEIKAPVVVFGVQLLFDALNPQDAFMADKLRFSPSDLSSGIQGLVKAVEGKHTVRPQINGLVGMILDSKSRKVSFLWRDMSFTGTVNAMQCEYNMFDLSGNPIRGSVTMGIVQSLEDKESKKKWENAYQKCFETSAGGKNALTKASNLLNINL